MRSAYIDQSYDVLRSIDVAQLSEVAPTQQIGRGTVYETFASGFTVAVKDTEYAVALKKPHADAPPNLRVSTDNDLGSQLREFSLLYDLGGEFEAVVPRFVAGLAIGGSDQILGFITEDASNNNEFLVRGGALPHTLAERIREDTGSRRRDGRPVNEENLMTCAFVAGGVHRILDVTPSLYGVRSIPFEEYGALRDRILNGDFTVTIDGDSPLGQWLSST